MRIAIEFDGTIVKDNYPEIGDEIPMAFGILKRLQKMGHVLILWTCRSGTELDQAVQFCKKNGLEFYAINKNSPDESPDQNGIQKIKADLFIDNQNLSGVPNWAEIFWMVHLHIYA